MLLPLAAAAVGALLMGTTKPRTAVTKLRSLGSISGVTYDIEDFPSAGFVVVRAPDGSEGVLSRKPKGGFAWSRGRGNPETLNRLCADFGISGLPAAPGSAPAH